MGPPVTLPSSLVGIREAIKGNFDSKEMQRTATAGFYAGFVGQGIEYTQIISNADYQLSMIITSAKGVNSINNPLSYLLFIKDFSLTQTIDAAKAGLQDVWNGTYDSAIGRKIGAGTFNYLLMTIGGAQLKGKGTACEAVESGSKTEVLLLETTKPITGKTNDHHIIPAFRGKSKPYADFISARGIDVDQYTITVDAGKGGMHMNIIHGKGGWNQKWMDFIDNNPNATAKDIYQFAGKMMDDYGLSGYTIHPYGGK